MGLDPVQRLRASVVRSEVTKRHDGRVAFVAVGVATAAVSDGHASTTSSAVRGYMPLQRASRASCRTLGDIRVAEVDLIPNLLAVGGG